MCKLVREWCRQRDAPWNIQTVTSCRSATRFMLRVADIVWIRLATPLDFILPRKGVCAQPVTNGDSKAAKPSLMILDGQCILWARLTGFEITSLLVRCA